MRKVLCLLLLSAPLFSQVRSAQDDSDRPKIDVESYAVEITLDTRDHKLTGKADLRFKQLDRKTYAVLDIDRRLRVTAATVGGIEARFRQFDVYSTVEVDLSSQQFNSNPVMHIEYDGVMDPEDDRHEPVLARVGGDSAFLLYAGKWFPTNGLYKDKADMKLKVNAPAGWTLVTDLPKTGDTFTSAQQSYWGTVVAGNYTATNVKSDKTQITVSTVKAAPDAVTPMAESVGKILDYYTEKFGPPASSTLRVIEVDGANWSSQWSIGTLLLPSTQFRKDFDADSLAISLAHQWFPLKIAVKDPSADAWLSDGMAVFASLLYFEKTLSPAESQEHIHKALVKALGYEGGTTIRQAGGMDKESPEYHSLVEYKGAYVMRMLRWVVGDETFEKLLGRYIQQFQNTPVSTEAFVKMASEIAGSDLNYFFEEWVNSTGVPEFKTDWVVNRVRNGYTVTGQIKQDLDLFKMPVELQIPTDGDPEYARVDVVGEASEFNVKTDRKAKTVVIDPREKILRMSNDIRVSVVINRGEEFANQGRYNDALDEFQKAVDIDAHNSLALFRMGEALFELGNVQVASNTFQDALNGDLKPKWVEVWSYIHRGKIYDIRDQRDRATTEYQKAVNTGDDAYGAQAEAAKYLKQPFRRAGRATIGN